MSPGILWTIPEIFPPVTGGELRFARHLDYLREHGAEVRVAARPRSPHPFLVDAVLGNIWNIKEFLTGRETTVIEQSMTRDDFLLANWVARIARRLKIVVFVLEVPDQSSLSKPRLLRRRLLFSPFLRSADAVIVASEATRQWVLGHRIPEDRVHVIPDSTRVRGDDLPIRATRNIPPRILCVAHIRENKGQRYLVEALHRIRDEEFTVQLAGVVKDQRYYDLLCDLIKRYGLEDRVQLVGMLEGEELMRAYADADIFVLPTLREGYGQVVAEAISFGLPIVASSVGAIPELVTDGAEGLLVPPADPQALGLALRRLLRDEVLRQTLGENARAKAKTLPSWTEINEKLHQVLTGLARAR